MTPHEHVQHLLDFIDASPSPWHVANSIALRLEAFGFQSLQETAPWPLKTGGRYYVVRDDSSLIAFVLGDKPLVSSGFKIVGAHTDSPGFRVKARPEQYSDQLLRLGVEIYGGPILATWADRDLSLAGRIAYQTPEGEIASHLVHINRPLLRLPNLPIHMNRNVNEDGLKLHKQNELGFILSHIANEQLEPDLFRQLLAELSGIEKQRLLGWELAVCDVQHGRFWGGEREFYSNSQLDNLASCHAALNALLEENSLNSGYTLVCAFFDHEEVGSESHKGAAGSFLEDTLERISIACELTGDDYQRTLAKSFLISADMAHAYQPGFPAAYDANHKLIVNQGPAIKINANQRYATSCVSQARFARWCELAEVPYQHYSHRCDLPCGSTIGPIASARLGIETVDVGNPMWAMHSVRESAGVFDHAYLIRALQSFFTQA